MRRKLEIILSFVLGIFFLYIAFKDINFRELLYSISNVNWIYIFSLLIMSILSIVIRAWRWKILLSPLKSVNYQRIFNFTMIGFMANNILPAHMGEIVRAYLLGEKEKISKISTFMTVFIERLFDFIILFFFLIITVFYISIPDWLKYGGLVIGSVSLILIILIFVLINIRMRDKFISKLIEKFPGKLAAKLSDKVNSLFKGLEILKRKHLILKIFFLSILLWLQIGLTISIGLIGFEFDVNLVLVSILLMVLTAFSITIPSTPGYFGNMQLAFIIGLGLVNIAKSDALACSLIFHLTQYIPVTFFGIILFIREGISFKQIMEKFKKGKTTKDREVKAV